MHDIVMIYYVKKDLDYKHDKIDYFEKKYDILLECFR